MSLRDHFVHDPPSVLICMRLQAMGAWKCEHGWNPCTLKCGVRAKIKMLEPREWEVDGVLYREERAVLDGPWEVAPYDERIAWLERIEKKIAAREARDGRE